MKKMLTLALLICLLLPSFASADLPLVVASATSELYTFQDIPWDTKKADIVDVAFEKTGLILKIAEHTKQYTSIKEQKITYGGKTARSAVFYYDDGNPSLAAVSLFFDIPRYSSKNKQNPTTDEIIAYYFLCLPYFYELRDILTNELGESDHSTILHHPSDNSPAGNFFLETLVPNGNWEQALPIVANDNVAYFAIHWDNIELQLFLGYPDDPSAFITVTYNDRLPDYSKILTVYEP